MRCARLIPFLVCLAGCEAELEVDGGLFDVSQTNIEIGTAHVKMVNGILYIAEFDTLGVTCIAIDPSTLYPDEWTSLAEMDMYRISDYTAEELETCEEIEREYEAYTVH